MIKHCLEQLAQLDNMCVYLLENGDALHEMPIEDQLAFASALQAVKTKTDAIEKRLRAELITAYDCVLGKSKSKTDKELGFKVESKRPLNIKFIKDTTDQEIMTSLEGVEDAAEILNTVFPANRSFHEKSFKALDEDMQKILGQFVESKEGQVAVKVTKLVQ